MIDLYLQVRAYIAELLVFSAKAKVRYIRC